MLGMWVEMLILTSWIVLRLSQFQVGYLRKWFVSFMAFQMKRPNNLLTTLLNEDSLLSGNLGIFGVFLIPTCN